MRDALIRCAWAGTDPLYCRYHDREWGVPVQNRRRSMKDLPARTEVSDAFSDDLKRRGFNFVGSTIMYAHMQAVGMVNDHVVSCFRHREVRKLAQRQPRNAE